MKPYVYKLVHKNTKEFYIGYRAANTLPAQEDILQYQTSSKKVQELGFDNFKIEFLIEFNSKEEAYDYEQNLIYENWKDPLILNGNYCLNKKIRFISPEFNEATREKLRQATLRRKSTGHVPYNKGKTGLFKHSEETKAFLSQSQKGKQFTEEHKRNISISAKNRKHSEETKQKIKDTLKLMGGPNKGKKFSEETKQKMRLAKLGTKRGPYKKSP